MNLEELDPEVRELLPMFLEGSRSRLESLAPLVAAKRFDEIRRLGHGLKGTSAMYQLTEFAVIGQALEQAALAADEITINRCGEEWHLRLLGLAAALD